MRRPSALTQRIGRLALAVFSVFLALPVAPAVGADQGKPAVPGGTGKAGLQESFGYGATVQLMGQPVAPLLNGITGMHFDWVRLPLRWADVEPDAGQYDWSQLDFVVDSVGDRGLDLLLVVAGTPGWARPQGADLTRDGPPANLSHWAAFLTALADRYTLEVAAYQIWQDPNAAANWDSPAGVSAKQYVQLLQVAYHAVKGSSPDALVISAGLYPTGQADGVSVVDDLTYLSIMYQTGVAAWCDAVGAHVNGTANPPSAYIDGHQSTSLPSAGESPLYYRHYEAIRQVMVRNGDEETPIWLTQVGWASLPGTPTDHEYSARVSEEQQAAYLVQAFRMAEQTPYIEAMMVDNFNLSTITPSAPEAGFSLIRADWTARPAFLQLAQMRQEQVLSNTGAARARGRNRSPQSWSKPFHQQPSPEVVLRE